MKAYPFLQPRFLAALEESGSTTAATGWQPCHQTVSDGDTRAFMPLYVKDHSYGEYVFDWAWADAYHRHGLAYYPKLVTAIPFTPATGPRVRFSGAGRRDAQVATLVDNTLELARREGASSWHLLFPDDDHLQLFERPDLLHRKGVQYHWHNRGYRSFDDFLATLNSRKRKMIRRERREVAGQRLTIERRTGDAIDTELWQAFALFYQRTYLKRSGSTGYLTPGFFTDFGPALADQCLMVAAWDSGRIIAAALYFFDDHTLFGRYWGCAREFDFLHFELCYYQGIEFAIEAGIHRFDAGAQGEHKIIRGFEPVVTHSLHWLAEPAFADAVARFLREESLHVDHHLERARELLPYRNPE